MASADFLHLESNINELKRIYLNASLGAAVASSDQSELSRAFAVLAHAEFEFFIEQLFEGLAKDVMVNAAAGRFISSSIALLTYSNIEQLAAGPLLTTSKADKRILSKRIANAYGKYSESIVENHGVREKYLAKLAIPMALAGDMIDPTWISDLDGFCTLRGAAAHKGRHFPDANPMGFNPTDIWKKCSALVWGNSALASPLISSFKDLDDWVIGQRAKFSSVVVATQTKPIFASLRSRLGNLFRY